MFLRLVFLSFGTANNRAGDSSPGRVVALSRLRVNVMDCVMIWQASEPQCLFIAQLVERGTVIRKP